ncbi:hypothetical protein DOE78_08095 [Bacillus sp. Y1]|nr:hypothetical protein [Bacillus sp. Y1]AYA75401.1 hypothetical protein DOE78_08095 [Bacillus sp. Y1]
MIQANLVQTMINRPESIEGNKQNFRAGQVFQGKVLKLFPNQTAEVQVGSQKVIAQLEIPLSAGERYWFQVQQGEGQVHLKVLTEGKGTGNANLEGLLKQFSIPETKTSIAILRFFLSEQLPITKESISMATSLLQGKTMTKEDLEAIKQLISRELPLTKATFDAVRSTIKSPSFHAVITSLKNELDALDILPQTGTRLKEAIVPYIQTGKEKLSAQVLQEIVRGWTQAKDPFASQQSLKALQQTGFLPIEDEQNILQQAAKRLIGLSEGKPQIQLPGIDSTAKQVSALIAAGNTEDVSTVLKNWIGGIMKDFHVSNQTIKQLFNLLSPNMDSATFDEAVSSLVSKDGIDANKALNKEVILELQAVRSQVDREPVEEFKSLLKSSIQTLGLSHESESFDIIKGKVSDEGARVENVKSLLIQLLNEDIPAKVKDSAEALLNRLTGIQLMSSDTTPVQQIVMQIPLVLMNKQTDLTIQWNGRKDANGKIDPSYCRVLFYLDLEHMNETIIDMQIQNRIMKITIINDHENIKHLSSPYIASLKASLQKLDYQLSNVSFQTQADRAVVKTKKATISSPLTSSYSGVDIKI